MATVSSFEGLRHPRASDLRQFRELFEPLFTASSDEARRQAASALARCAYVPPNVALQIGSAPIAIAALFLTRTVAIDDAVLLQIIRTQSTAHANAIARRDKLSVRVVDALVEARDSAPAPTRQTEIRPRQTATGMDEPADAVPSAKDAMPAREQNLLREEELRAEIKALARVAATAGPGPRRALAPLDQTHDALLVRFARTGEVNLFAATLAHALNCSTAFGERLVLDVSGWQLAMSLSALGFARADRITILTALYPYLGERNGATTRGETLLDGIDPTEARTRVEGWIAADDRQQPDGHRHMPQVGPDRADDPRQAPANRQTAQVTSTFYRRTLSRGMR